MIDTNVVGMPPRETATRQTAVAFSRTLVIGLTAFLTVVDLFATQAILPSLVKAYQVSPAAMGFAVNASTMGMAVAGLAVAFFSRRIDRRRGILISLMLLSIPTALLAVAPDLMIFTALRISQGVLMATAFTLTLAYLGEECSAADAAGAFAAYITGNVASNLFGRLISAGVADHLGLAANFYLFALLNLAGALLVYLTLGRTPSMAAMEPARRSPWAIWAVHLRNAPLRASFAIGFCILFAFIGTFTYVNFVLVRAPFALGMMALGTVYLVFLPSIITTPAAGGAVRRFGTRPTLVGSLAVAAIGLPLLLLPSLAAELAGPRWSASVRSSRRRQQRASSVVPRPPTAARRAVSTSPVTSSAVSSAAPSSVKSSIAWGGPLALPASQCR
jgi:YNFM family putative membrane transporter